MAKRAVILNGDNEIGRAIVTQLRPDYAEIVIVGESESAMQSAKTGASYERIAYNEDYAQKIMFAQQEITSLVAIANPDDMGNGDKDLAEQVWPWIFVLKYLVQRNIPLPRYVVIVLAGFNPDLFALQSVQARYITANSFDFDIHINFVNADFYRNDSGELSPRLAGIYGPEVDTSADQIADAVSILCSGLMDGMKAQSLYLRMGLSTLAADSDIDQGRLLD